MQNSGIEERKDHVDIIDEFGRKMCPNHPYWPIAVCDICNPFRNGYSHIDYFEVMDLIKKKKQ